MDKKKVIKDTIIGICDFVEFGYKKESKRGFSLTFSSDDPRGYMLIDKGVDKRIRKILNVRGIYCDMDTWFNIDPSPCAYPIVTINIKLKEEHYGSNIIIRHGR